MLDFSEKPYLLFEGDCLETLKRLPDNSISAICTDPPYGLSDHKPADVVACLSAWLKGEEYRPKKRGFMGRSWDAWVPGPEVWREAFRVLKPGGHIVAFAGSRTHDLMSMALRLAGFECRDTVMYLYGSGFPKSLDVSKAIDKAGGASPREQSEMLRAKRQAAGLSREQVAKVVGCTPSSVRDWEEGRARATGAAIEFIVPSDDYRTKLADLLGYSADERRLIGAAADRRGDGSVYGVGHSGNLRTGGNTDAARQWQGWGTALKPAFEPALLFRKPLIGTVAENVLAHGTGALNIDGCRVPTAGEQDEADYREKCASVVGLRSNRNGNAYGEWTGERQDSASPMGRWPANLCHDGSEEVVALFPWSKDGVAGKRTGQNGVGNWGYAAQDQEWGGYGGAGSAARFFYCAKASRKDRSEGMEAKEFYSLNEDVPSDVLEKIYAALAK